MSNVITEKMYDVTIDETEVVYDKEQQRVVKELCGNVCNDRVSGSSPLIAVLKAYDSCREGITDLNMIDVRVDGLPFPG